MTSIAMALVLILVLIRNQLRHKPIKRSLFTMPLILFIYGVYLAQEAGVQSGEALALGISLVLGGMVGMVQGKMVKVYQEQNIWWVAGSVVTLLIWLISIPIRMVVKFGYIQLFHVPTVLTGDLAYVPFIFSLAGILIGKVIMLSIRYPEQMKAAANDEYRRSKRRI